MDNESKANLVSSGEENSTPRENKEKQKKKKEPSQRRRTITRIIVGGLVGIGLLYAVFLFVTTNFMGNNNVVTEMAVRYTAADMIKTTGVVVRNEECLKNEHEGVLVYRVQDGDKVTVDGVVADVYQNENDAVAQSKIKEIDESIKYLQELSNESTSVNVGLDSVNNQINTKLVTLLKEVNKQNFSNIDTYEDELMSSIYRKQVIMGEQGDFTEKIAQLNEQKLKYQESCNDSIGTVKTDSSGYFVSSTDGFENVFDLSKLDEVTPKQLESIEPNKENSDSYIGKVIKGVNWYLLCEITGDEATAMLHNSADVQIKLPYAVLGEIPAKIISVNQSTDGDKCVLVLQCNYMNNSLSKIRKESLDVVINTYKGLKVSKAALHDDYVSKVVEKEDGSKETLKEKVQGVYVEYGNELVFKQVVVIHSGDDYVICDEEPDENVLFNGTTISLYDEVVTQGSDLFDGKIIG